jgi:hypothetical protein
MEEMENSKKKEVLSYINSQKESGVPLDKIKSDLINQGGWTEADLDRLLRHSETTPVESAPQADESAKVASEQGKEAEKPLGTQNHNKAMVIFVVVIIFLLLAGIGGYFYMQNNMIDSPPVVVDAEIDKGKIQKAKTPPTNTGDPKLNLELLDAIANKDPAKVQSVLAKGANLNYATTNEWFFVDGERRRVGRELFGVNAWPLPVEYSEFTKEEIKKEFDSVVSEISTDSLIPLSQGVPLPEEELTEGNYKKYYIFFVAPEESDKEKEWVRLRIGSKPIDLANKIGDTAIIDLLSENQN